MLLMEHIDKKFWGQYANQDVNLKVEKGEVHALLGENGAGKTTLMNILYGIYKRDGGNIVWKGEPVNFSSPKDAIKRNIGMVHQHFMLVPTLTVSQNITLGLKEKGYPFTNRKAIDEKIMALSERYGLPVDPGAYVNTLSVGEQQRVEIMKLLYRGAELLILDEPTAVLTPQEIHGFFEVLKKLRADGCSVILITHRIPEVLEIADMVTVLRDTKSIVTAPIGNLDETSLSEHMIGRPLKPVQRPEVECGCKEGLKLQDVNLQEKGRQKLTGINIEIPCGEVLGIAGVDGNGQKELAEVILGIRRHTGGHISLCEESMDNADVRQRKQKGMAYISDDRHHDGLIMDMDLTDNMFLKFNSDKRFLRNGLLSYKQMRDKTQQDIEEFRIKTPSAEVPIRYLSGGNQQKLILAREMSDQPVLIVAFQPTRGLDIGAAEFVQQQLLQRRKEGAAVLLISADLEEILALSDRVAVINKGKIMGVLQNHQGIDTTQIGLMMLRDDDNRYRVILESIQQLVGVVFAEVLARENHGRA